MDMWETKEQRVIKEERPYDHTKYMDYLRWYRRSTRIRLCTPRISNAHEDGASGRSATGDVEDPLRASRLRYTPRAHLIHSVVRCDFVHNAHAIIKSRDSGYVLLQIIMHISDAYTFRLRLTNSRSWRRRQLLKRAAPEANVMLSLRESLEHV